MRKETHINTHPIIQQACLIAHVIFFLFFFKSSNQHIISINNVSKNKTKRNKSIHNFDRVPFIYFTAESPLTRPYTTHSTNEFPGIPANRLPMKHMYYSALTCRQLFVLQSASETAPVQPTAPVQTICLSYIFKMRALR